MLWVEKKKSVAKHVFKKKDDKRLPDKYKLKDKKELDNKKLKDNNRSPRAKDVEEKVRLKRRPLRDKDKPLKQEEGNSKQQVEIIQVISHREELKVIKNHPLEEEVILARSGEVPLLVAEETVYTESSEMTAEDNKQVLIITELKE